MERKYILSVIHEKYNSNTIPKEHLSIVCDILSRVGVDVTGTIPDKYDCAGWNITLKNGRMRTPMTWALLVCNSREVLYTSLAINGINNPDDTVRSIRSCTLGTVRARTK